MKTEIKEEATREIPDINWETPEVQCLLSVLPGCEGDNSTELNEIHVQRQLQRKEIMQGNPYVITHLEEENPATPENPKYILGLAWEYILKNQSAKTPNEENIQEMLEVLKGQERDIDLRYATLTDLTIDPSIFFEPGTKGRDLRLNLNGANLSNISMYEDLFDGNHKQADPKEERNTLDISLTKANVRDCEFYDHSDTYAGTSIVISDMNLTKPKRCNFSGVTLGSYWTLPSCRVNGCLLESPRFSGDRSYWNENKFPDWAVHAKLHLQEMHGSTVHINPEGFNVRSLNLEDLDGIVHLDTTDQITGKNQPIKVNYLRVEHNNMAGVVLHRLRVSEPLFDLSKNPSESARTHWDNEETQEGLAQMLRNVRYKIESGEWNNMQYLQDLLRVGYTVIAPNGDTVNINIDGKGNTVTKVLAESIKKAPWWKNMFRRNP